MSVESQFAELRERMKAIETLTENKWAEHERRSTQTWLSFNSTIDRLEKSLVVLFQKTSEIIEKSAAKKAECMKEAKEGADTALNSMKQGINATIGASIAISSILITIILFLVDKVLKH